MNNFKVGDIVEAWGVRGVVVPNDYDDSICVQFEGHDPVYFFYPDGKEKKWHKELSLKLIERPIKTKKIKVWIDAQLIPDYLDSLFLRVSKDRVTADTYGTHDSIVQEIEIEVYDD